ncbi:MAG: hypothetical protein RLZZ450_5996 [Pseudomonadota bacterium]|jgi:hypothetical protein
MSWLSRSTVCASLVLSACGFHFDDFHAASVALDAATPTATNDPGPATAAQPSASDASIDGSRAGNEATTRPDAGPGAVVSSDAGPANDVCVGASGSCVCAASACPVTDAAAPVVPPASTPAAMPTVPVTPPTPTSVPTPGLRLRYDFAGQGPLLEDRVGSAHATLLGGAQLDGSGSLTLDGSDDYASVPSAALASLDSVTLVAWIVSTTPTCWQRVFDIGATRGTPGDLTSDVLLTGELFLTPDACPDQHVAVVARNAMSRQEAQSPASLPRNRVVQLAVVVDGTRQTITLYIDGARANETGSTMSLRALSDATFWLGRSLWRQDPRARLRFDQFRLYDRALGAEQIAEVARRGADVL